MRINYVRYPTVRREPPAHCNALASSDKSATIQASKSSQLEQRPCECDGV